MMCYSAMACQLQYQNVTDLGPMDVLEAKHEMACILTQLQNINPKLNFQKKKRVFDGKEQWIELNREACKRSCDEIEEVTISEDVGKAGPSGSPDSNSTSSKKLCTEHLPKES